MAEEIGIRRGEKGEETGEKGEEKGEKVKEKAEKGSHVCAAVATWSFGALAIEVAVPLLLGGAYLLFLALLSSFRCPCIGYNLNIICIII